MTVCGRGTSDPGLARGPCDVASRRSTDLKKERGRQGLGTIARAGAGPPSVGETAFNRRVVDAVVLYTTKHYRE